MEGVFSLTQRDVLTCKVSYNLFFFFTFFTCFHYSIHIKSKDAYSNDWIDKVILQIRFIPKLSLSQDFVINGMNDGTFWKNSHGIWN